ncbi:urea ABC transporter permease subunit UrtC, partial [Mesorhizobium sp. USDA-HM6]
MITQGFFGAGRRIAITVLILLAAAVVVPLLNLAVSPTSAFYIPPYIVALLGKYLCYALLAL